MWMIAANFRRTHSPSRLAWSEGWRPPGAQSTFIRWTGWTLAMTLGHDDSTINTVMAIIITRCEPHTHTRTHTVVLAQSSTSLSLSGRSFSFPPCRYFGSGIFSPNAAISCSRVIMPLAKSFDHSPMSLNMSTWPWPASLSLCTNKTHTDISNTEIKTYIQNLSYHRQLCLMATGHVNCELKISISPVPLRLFLPWDSMITGISIFSMR